MGISAESAGSFKDHSTSDQFRRTHGTTAPLGESAEATKNPQSETTPQPGVSLAKLRDVVTTEPPKPFSTRDETPRTEPTALSPREQLTKACLNKQTVGQDLSLVPGAYAEYDVADEAKDISEGEFGLVIKSVKTGEPIARSGFDIDRTGERLIIGHPPQGARKTEVSRDAWGEIVGQGDTFRTRLVNGIVGIAQNLGLTEVVGVSAENHLGVQYKHIPEEKGTRIMDDVYTATGFEKGQDGNFHKRLEGK